METAAGAAVEDIVAVEALELAGNRYSGAAGSYRIVVVGILSIVGTETVGTAAENLESFVADLSHSAGNCLEEVQILTIKIFRKKR